MAIKYTEENGQYSIDCTTALWSTDEIHKYYQDAAHTYGIIGFLCDVVTFYWLNIKMLLFQARRILNGLILPVKTNWRMLLRSFMILPIGFI